jgi:predicted AlkP superfamily phosphohydrolase/phosphomutase
VKSKRNWMGYAALAMLFVIALLGVPHRVRHREDESARPKATKYPRVVVLGIDGMDPDILRETIALFPDRMRNFAQLAKENGIHELDTSTPPQSPVAWSNFITGLNPGGHGIFEFFHRDTVHRAPIPATVVNEPMGEIPIWPGWKLPTGGAVKSNRSGKAFWTVLAEHGVPADIWRMPANFPVEPADGWSFSGMMTPAVDSAYGECTRYTTHELSVKQTFDHRIVGLREFGGGGVFNTHLDGPANVFEKGEPTVTVPMKLLVDRDANALALEVGDQKLVLEPGEWSDFVTVSFEMLPGWIPVPGQSASGIVRFYLRSIEPEIELYASPVNIDPSAPIAPVSEPADASAKLADKHSGGVGNYYTQGMPEDVNALKREVLTDREFMQQSKLVQNEGEHILDYALDHYLEKPDGGVLFFYFSGIDLCSHMMWRHADAKHPFHDEELANEDSSKWSHRPGSTWKDVIHDLYMEMDPVLGRVRERLGDDATLIVMSDHGFAPYSRKFNLNTWLYDNGYLVLREGYAKEPADDDPEHRVSISSFTPKPEDVAPSDWPHRTIVDWKKTRAYSVGFNALFLNLAGREQNDPATSDDESGIVTSEQADALLREIKAKLEACVDPQNSKHPVLRCDLAKDVYSGSRTREAPDMIVGFDSGYGQSDEGAVGRITHDFLVDNDRQGTFNGSHLMAPEIVRGSLLSNRVIADGPHALADVTVEILRHYGIAPEAGMKGQPVLATGN